jgi:hypothetical protein
MAQVRFRIVPMMAFLTLATAGGAWARCGTERQLAHLETKPIKCSPGQLVALQRVLGNRLQFRESLDLPLAQKVLEERKCPSVEEYQAFFDAWKQLPGTGVVYTAKKYCQTTPTFYLIRFTAPDKPLDDAAAAKLGDDIERLQNLVIPALESKRTEVDALVR